MESPPTTGGISIASPPAVVHRRIAIAIDRTVHSVDAFNWYVKFLRRHNDVVALIHCVEPAMVQTVGAYPLCKSGLPVPLGLPSTFLLFNLADGLDPLVVGMYSQMDHDSRKTGEMLLDKAAAILVRRGVNNTHFLMSSIGRPLN